MYKNQSLPLKIAFLDFWEGVNINEVINFLHLNDYNFIEDYINPDLVVYSCFGERHLDYTHSKLLFYCGENVIPDFNICDFAISSVKIQYENRNLWIPCSHISTLSHVPDNTREITPELLNRKFCSFIYSQDKLGKGAKYRKIFCEQLMQKYKHVDCPGRILHNMESELLTKREDFQNWHASKLHFLNGYKFNIAFENSDAPGYITEKLSDCYIANTVPIYWGSSADIAPYPKESMICANNYNSIDDLIARIIEVDNNDELYLSILRANPFIKENKKDFPNFSQQIKLFIANILEYDNSVKENYKSHAKMTDAYRCYCYRKAFQQKHIKIAHRITKYIKQFKYRCLNFFKHKFPDGGSASTM